MERWFSENWTDNIKFSIKIKEHLYSNKTKFQQLDFYDSYELGRFFTLDNIMMANEKDEFIYHEMMIHTPMSVNPNIKTALVIGGGDGGSVRELVKYKSIESIDMVEIDEEVVRMCEKYLPLTSSGLSDKRVKLYFEDGVKFVSESKKKYDLIVVDSTDPIGPGEGLFTYVFYKNLSKILNDDGILVNQHESPYFESTRVIAKRSHDKLKDIFPIATVYQAFIPTYPSGHWLFGFASKKMDPINDFKKDIQLVNNISTNYYNNEIHLASFVLPNYVKDILNKN